MILRTLFLAPIVLLPWIPLGAEPFLDSAEKLLRRLQQDPPPGPPAAAAPPGLWFPQFAEPERFVPDHPLTKAQVEILLDTIFFRHPARPAPGQLELLVEQLGSAEKKVAERASQKLLDWGSLAGAVIQGAAWGVDQHPERSARAKTLSKVLSKRNYYLRKRLHHLIGQTPPARWPDLLDGFLERQNREADHGLPAVAAGSIATSILKSDSPELIYRLEPLLDCDDRGIALAFLRAISPWEHLPVHPLFLRAFAHPRDDVVFYAMKIDADIPDRDPLKQQVAAGIVAGLARPHPPEVGLEAARILISKFFHPAGIRYLQEPPADLDPKEIARLIATALPSGLKLSHDFVGHMAEFSSSPDPEIRIATTSFLLQRHHKDQIRFGIELLETLELTDREIEVLANNFPPQNLPELRRRIVNDDGTGPGGNAIRLLESIRETNPRPSPMLQALGIR